VLNASINSNVFYQVRNSLIHFSSIPNISNVGIFISSDSKFEFCNRYPNETAGREIIVLSLKILLSIFLKASIQTKLLKRNKNKNSNLLSLDIKIPTLEMLGMLLKWIRLFLTW
jgi:hypothetical protein